MSDDYDDEVDEEIDDEAEVGELCPSCNEYLLDGNSSGDVIECPICGNRVRLT